MYCRCDSENSNAVISIPSHSPHFFTTTGCKNPLKKSSSDNGEIKTANEENSSRYLFSRPLYMSGVSWLVSSKIPKLIKLVDKTNKKLAAIEVRTMVLFFMFVPKKIDKEFFGFLTAK